MNRRKTNLLIGATGFIGYNLAHYLVRRGEKVIGTFVHRSKDQVFDPRITLVHCDVTKQTEVNQVLRRFLPDYIYYLAAQSSVRHAWLKPVEAIEINFLGGARLLEAAKRFIPKVRILIFSSCTTYGFSYDSGKQLNEEACLKPKDPYSISKTAIDSFAQLYARVYGLHICVVRLANLTGPGQSTVFSIPNFASQIARLELRKSPHVLEVGNLTVERDYLDIRDGVPALYLAMKKGRKGEAYNIASGKSRTLQSVLKNLISLSRLNQKKVKIKRKSTLLPKDEIASLRLDSSKFKRLSGWKARIPFRETLLDLLNEWRQKLD